MFSRRFIANYVALCASVCTHISAFAQIKGKVINAQNNAVPFATIVLRSLPDSAVLKTELTDTTGNYTITAVDKYPALLTVFAGGYDRGSRLVNIADQTIDFTLTASAHTIQDVTISAQKKLIERLIDRTIFNVESSVSSIGSDAFEALKKAPGVQVSNGIISIAGKSTVSVMINDRLLQLPADELESMLRSIPADDISRIEVITTPPSRYDAQGNAGIINFVTRKSAKNGFNGNITASYTQRVRGSEGLEGAFNWRQGRLNVYGNGNSNWMTFSSLQNTTTFFTTSQQQMHLDQVNSPWFYRADAGAEYNLTDNSTIGITYTNGNLNKSVEQSYTTNVFNPVQNHVDSIMNTDAHTREYGHRDVAGLNYEWKIDSTGKRLTANTTYFDRKGNTFRSADLKNYYTDGSPTGFSNSNTTYGNNNVLMKDARLDLVLPYQFATLSFGGKASTVQNSSSNIFSNVYGGTYVVLDTSRTDHFIYTENVQALYISAQKIWGKWEAKAGLRAEYTQTRAISVALSEVNNNDYLKFFPTAYLLYKKDEDNVVGITYSHRIDRPDFWSMNPFREYLTANSWDQGNPFLQPSSSNNAELNYTWKSSYTITLSAGQVQHDVAHIATIDSVHNLYYYTEANSGNNTHYGLTFAANVSPTKWWEGNAQLYGYYNTFSSDYYGKLVRYSLAAFYAEARSSFVINSSRTLMAEIGFNYTSQQQAGYNLQLAEFFAWGGLKALFFRKQLTVALNTEDPFRTNRDRLRNLYNGTIENNYFDARELLLAVTLKFGNRYIKDKPEHGMSIEDAKRLK